MTWTSGKKTPVKTAAKNSYRRKIIVIRCFKIKWRKQKWEENK